MAGGFKVFGPTYNSTQYLRLGIEGDINGNHLIDVDAAKLVDGELAGRIAAIGAKGIKPAAAGAGDAVGVFSEDLGDMMNASFKASFYFRGGEYYVAASRLGAPIADFVLGSEITTDDKGAIIPLTDDAQRPVGVVVYTGEYKSGNMYEWAGSEANGGEFLGFILKNL